MRIFSRTKSLIRQELSVCWTFIFGNYFFLHDNPSIKSKAACSKQGLNYGTLRITRRAPRGACRTARPSTGAHLMAPSNVPILLYSLYWDDNCSDSANFKRSLHWWLGKAGNWAVESRIRRENGKNKIPHESQVACHKWQMGIFTHPFFLSQLQYHSW